MPIPCKVCTDTRRKELEQALVTGATRAVARRFNISHDSLQRHRTKCMPRAIARVAAREAAEFSHTEDILNRLEALTAQSQQAVDRAEAAGEVRTMLLAVKEVRGNLELLAKLTGGLRTSRSAELHLHLPPEQALLLAQTYAARHGVDVAETLPNCLPQTIEAIAPPIDQEPIAIAVDSTTPEEGHDDGQEDPDA